jgi:PTH1 family peptidyl-tRNA hydrolase
MKLIIGLGNPEDEENFAKSRHNMGFDVVNSIATKYDIKLNKNRFYGIYGLGEIEGTKVILVKPQTYMNLSGECVWRMMKFFKIDIKNILVIYDDFDTEPGTIRIRKFGSAGSHKGMISIIQCLGSDKFSRIRVGIGRPEHIGEIVDYVISKVPEEEMEVLLSGVDKATKATIEYLKSGIDSAMNKYN